MQMLHNLRSWLVGSCVALGGCGACQDISCGAPFSLAVLMEMGQAFPDGDYAFELRLEDSEFAIHCRIEGDASCDAPMRTSGTQSFEILMFPPPAGGAAPFELEVNDPSGSTQHGEVSNCRGPEFVGLRVLRGETEIGSFEETLEYERDSEYRGEHCGTADAVEAREVEVRGP